MSLISSRRNPRLRVPPKQRAQQLRPRHPVRGEQFAINYNHEASSHVRPCRAARAVRNICLVSARFRAGPIPTLRSLWHGPPLRRRRRRKRCERPKDARNASCCARQRTPPGQPHPSAATYILGYIPPPHPSAATYILGYITPLHPSAATYILGYHAARAGPAPSIRCNLYPRIYPAAPSIRRNLYPRISRRSPTVRRAAHAGPAAPRAIRQKQPISRDISPAPLPSYTPLTWAPPRASAR